MKKSSVYVVPSAGGWAVQSKIGRQETKLYGSKEDAVTAARKATRSRGGVVVQTSSGQVLRPAEVKTSRDADSMRAAVLQAVKKKSITRER